VNYDWARYHPNGYECSTAGDQRFSSLVARLSDGRSIEDAYQLDVKGYRIRGSDWRLGKGRRALSPGVNLWQSYLDLWGQWANQNPALMLDLAARAHYGILTDRYASTGISQARALAHLLNARHALSESNSTPAAGIPPAPRASAVRVPAVQSLAPARGKR
jgi:hypothetical protein